MADGKSEIMPERIAGGYGMNQYKKLANNSLLFFIANFGSRILTFLMVPYYTYSLSMAEYGTVDVLVSTISLAVPLVTFSMGDIVTLYLVKKQYSVETIFTNSIMLLAVGNLFILILFPVIYSIDTFKPYIHYFFLLILVQSFYSVFQSYARGIGKVAAFAISGIIYTASLVSLNIYFLTYCKMGIPGYLQSMIIAYAVGILFLALSIGRFRAFRLQTFNRGYIKGLLKLSIPILPTAVLWWIMNISDKYSILFFMSVSANGLYTVAHKIPTILSMLYNVFQQAWQLSTMEMESRFERSNMYSHLFEVLTCLLAGATSILIIAAKPVILVFCEAAYAEAWKVVPLLLYSAVYNALSGFFGSNYIPMKKTINALKITVIGTIINIILNVILVPIWGLQGAALATCAGFLYMTVHKMLDTREFTPLDINIRRFAVSNLLIIVQMIVTINAYEWAGYLVGISVLLILLIMYRDVEGEILNKAWKVIKKKQKIDKTGRRM